MPYVSKREGLKQPDGNNLVLIKIYISMHVYSRMNQPTPDQSQETRVYYKSGKYQEVYIILYR